MSGTGSSRGKGIEKIQEDCKAVNALPPEFSSDATGLMIKFRTKDMGQRTKTKKEDK
ncbi:MAG: hypothetical protein HOG03_19350 [Desulfobacula sp.]|uniref:hypothetical protein n=1 Tax=Desulfobacula sp. TaxID=2593537 RepID=UPI001D231114|nr:hypothetical protein [Desulfobacula sp.]MBT3486183.1 hypothetical protein [Desulfobacula sp.]MBT3806728.1 hypothetical protein [Desulfobacula sp.]MBT4026670.1 hypothetical protein [Desulfobacula sp.]MBT4200743.1 hypothetical protein [Desulfobacula sp.]